jgi:hypothetical protein
MALELRGSCLEEVSVTPPHQRMNGLRIILVRVLLEDEPVWTCGG